jgi:hypothetical protein
MGLSRATREAVQILFLQFISLLMSAIDTGAKRDITSGVLPRKPRSTVAQRRVQPVTNVKNFGDVLHGSRETAISDHQELMDFS